MPSAEAYSLAPNCPVPLGQATGTLGRDRVAGLVGSLLRGPFKGLKPIASRPMVVGGGTLSNGTTDLSLTSRMSHYSPAQVRAVALLYGAWHAVATTFPPDATTIPGCEGNTGADHLYRASIEYPFGVRQRKYFGRGADSAALSGGGMALAEPLAVNIPANTQFWSNTYVQVPTGQKLYLGRQCITSGEGEYSNLPSAAASSSGTDLTANQSGVVTGAGPGVYSHGPIGVFGVTYPEVVAVACLGTSISAGIGHAVSSAGNVGSWFDRAMGKTTPCLNLAAAGSRVRDWADYPHVFANRLLLALTCDYVVVEWGANDLSSRSVAQIQGYLTALVGYLAGLGKRVILATICPHTTSTNNWATAANQTPYGTTDAVDGTYNTPELRRVAMNNWYRTVPAGAYACWDLASAVECDAAGTPTVNGGRWTPGTVHLTDAAGLHPSDLGHTTIGAAVDKTILSLY